MSTTVIAVAIATIAPVCAATIVAESAVVASGDVLDDVCIADVPFDLSVGAFATVVGTVSDAAW